MIMNIKI